MANRMLVTICSALTSVVSTDRLLDSGFLNAFLPPWKFVAERSASKGACPSLQDHTAITNDVTWIPSVPDKVILATHIGTGWQ